MHGIWPRPGRSEICRGRPRGVFRTAYARLVFAAMAAGIVSALVAGRMVAHPLG